jgi:quinol monooxygenase YgiN
MACYVVLEARAKPGTGDALLALVEKMLPDTRDKPGCLNIDVTRNMNDPDDLLLVMRWESRGHYERYYQWRVERGDLNLLGGALAASPSIRFFEITGV